MSTRANIIIKDLSGQLIFYRHSDGYPEVTAKSLAIFLDWVKSGKIRDNINQAAGWLVLLGNAEYADKGFCGTIFGHTRMESGSYSWKCGAYEPTDLIHGDIEYFYEIDLRNKTLRCWVWNMGKGEKGREVDITEYLI